MNVKIEKLEREIEQEQRNVAYDTREYTIEYIVDKYLKGVDKDENEFLSQIIKGNLFGVMSDNLNL